MAVAIEMGGFGVAVVASPTELRSLASAIRDGRDYGPVRVRREGDGVRASDVAGDLLVTGSVAALDLLAATIDNVARAAEEAGASSDMDRHADLDSVTNTWVAADSLPLEIVGRVRT